MEKDLAISGLAHDLNNLFQTLVAAADRLSEDPSTNDVSQLILRTVERGRRISLGLQGARSPGASFASILDDAITFIQDARPSALWPEIRFERKLNGDVTIRRNWEWERLLINLFLNSARAMPEGGRIEVEAGRKGADFRVAVRDTGTGIAPHLLDRVFQPHISTKPNGGLGLHVVETIVKEDGGRIRAKNRADGPGAEFLISVPIAVAGVAVPLAARA